MSKKPKYYLAANGEFVIENYHLSKPFSSFFPGIAGVWGIPLWAFYVNRGQAIASFGTKDKDHPILEFRPANQAYQAVSLLGFRTLLKVQRGKKNIFYDAFNNGVSSACFDVENKMLISSSELILKETNRTLGLETTVEYFTIPNDSYAALARKVSFKNISKRTLNVELLDGLPQIIPYGMNQFLLKEMSRTIEAWMAVENLEKNSAYLRLKQDPADRPEVAHISEGNFYLAFDEKSLLRPIVEPEAVFGRVSDFSYPQAFLQKTNFAYPKKQITHGRTPCCFVYKKIELKPQDTYELHSFIGNIDSLEKLNTLRARIATKEYFTQKKLENKQEIQRIEQIVGTHSGSKQFDLYCGQNFLDNVLRGGFPVELETKAGTVTIQAYSRKHGDLERDYNRFLLEPTYFSQGNGNYRDANQNRRSDIWFNPLIKGSALITFFSLLQVDGYNPLVIKPDNFLFQGDGAFLSTFFASGDAKKVKKLLEKPFTPGELLSFIPTLQNRGLQAADGVPTFQLEQVGRDSAPSGQNKNEPRAPSQEGFIEQGVKGFIRREEFLKEVLASSLRILNAEHGEGFWTDHWAYCLDLLEAYLGVYPENLRWVLLENKEFTFFDNSEGVRPRKEKYVLRSGKVFQYHSVVNNHAKQALIKKRERLPHMSRLLQGQGDVYTTALLVKMLIVIANKFSSLDPFGVGIEMDANKPNWYDALNGLPGLLGSSSCETFELKRWILFIKESLEKIALDEASAVISLPKEAYDLFTGLGAIAVAESTDYIFWDKTHTLREEYLHRTLMGFSGVEKPISIAELKSILDTYLKKLDAGLEKAYDRSQQLHYSYFINEVSEYETIEENVHGHFIKPLKFTQKPLPLFLEAVVHFLRVADRKEKAKEAFEAVRKSHLYDKKLKMYKVNASLKDMPEEIGRCRVFTPGWLENESIWLHMEYKYILELLKNGLYEEFFEDFKQVLIPFQDPVRYGRSILENSSFLVSSAFPDEKLHGSGFVARLSGSTAEFISIWLLMCAGKQPFYLDKENKLCLEFRPILPGWLFSQKEEFGFPKNSFAFKFLNKTLVVYHNPKRKDTFGPKAAKIKEITLKPQDKPNVILKTSHINSSFALDVRAGKIARIDILLS